MDREEWIIWIISDNRYAILGDWISNKYVSEGQGQSKQDRGGLGKANFETFRTPRGKGTDIFCGWISLMTPWLIG